MEIRKVYRESMPEVKLVGKRLTNKDRDESGTFAKYWQLAFREGWFDTLKKGGALPGVSDDYVGAMRMVSETEFEYWIGLFLAPDAAVPDGFESEIIPAGDVGICWVYGNDKSGELYGMEASDACMAALKEKGWGVEDTGWFLERYNEHRFTVPDESGNVILDIGAYLVDRG